MSCTTAAVTRVATVRAAETGRSVRRRRGDRPKVQRRPMLGQRGLMRPLGAFHRVDRLTDSHILVRCQTSLTGPGGVDRRIGRTGLSRGSTREQPRTDRESGEQRQLEHYAD
ncbi:hypothetical protein [Fodinicola feengrottensis]|uniref:hypothetical protein n=1 Tax=Fodinicola feengrottensis TaxID=435914 RepID=UPI0013D80DF4|nr:hypothetical protein [Fodinicola feengrottensis]